MSERHYLTGPDFSHIVGVRIDKLGPVRYFDASGHDVEVGDKILVETENGRAVGEVVIASHQILSSDLRGPLEPVLQALPDRD